MSSAKKKVLKTLLSIFNYGIYRMGINFYYMKLKAKSMKIWSMDDINGKETASGPK